ncbi:hypothetical protein BH09BAC3_BH09BAC3_09650 [soil metagenome]
MENLPKNEFESEDDLRASTELLRLKLEMDYNMKISHTSELPPEIENKWLSNIYNFEEQYKNSKPTKVRELIGNPFFPASEELNDLQIREQLARVMGLLEEKHIALDCCCEYEDRVIYKFIVEELFDHETDNFSLEGMTWHFIYEEFHPNHKYDLNRYATQFMDTLLTRKWDEEYDVYKLAKTIQFRGKELPQKTISSMILAFQAAHNFFEVEEVTVEGIDIYLANKIGRVNGTIRYISYPKEDTPRKFLGPFVINFVFDATDWDICGIDIPGFES